MSIETLKMSGFRNHKEKHIEFGPGVNVIWGENGSGKTSILEAVYILSNGKSFKTNKLIEAIKNGSTETTLWLEISDLKTEIKSSYQDDNGVVGQTEYWWRVTGDVHPTDRRLWTFYHGLKNKRESEEELNMVGDYKNGN